MFNKALKAALVILNNTAHSLSLFKIDELLFKKLFSWLNVLLYNSSIPESDVKLELLFLSLHALLL